MQGLRERLGQPIGQGLGDDRVVVIVFRLELPDHRVDAET